MGPWAEGRLALNARIVVEMILRREEKAKNSKTRKVKDMTVATVSTLGDLSAVIGSLLTAYPPADMVWNGVMAVLPALVKPIINSSALVEGLQYVMRQLDYQTSISTALLRKSWKNDDIYQELRFQIANRVVLLFKAVLSYQIKAVCRAYATHSFIAGFAEVVEGLMSSESWIVSDLESMKKVENDLRLEVNQYLSQSSTTLLAEGVALLGETANYEITRDEQQLVGMFAKTAYEDAIRSLATREKGTCEWFFNQEAFKEWLKSGDDKKRIYVAAGPGVGKSVLAKSLVKEILPEHHPSATICYFFFTDTAEQQSGTAAVSALLHQLFLKNPRLVTECSAMIRTRGTTVTDNITALGEIWNKALSLDEAGEVWIVIDALNQCNLIYQESFLETITRPSNRVKLLVTTQPLLPIEKTLKERGFSDSISLSGDGEEGSKRVRDEIRLEMCRRVHKLAQDRGWDESRRDWLADRLERKGAGQNTYLWVKIIFALLERNENDMKSVWEQLVDDLPEDISAAYEELLMPATDKTKVRHLLELIISARRPLTLRESNIAVHILEEERKKDNAKYHERDIDKPPNDGSFERWIRKECNFFVTVENGRLGLMHPTAYEWLRKEEAPAKFKFDAATRSKWQHSISKEDANRTMATSCIAYLSLLDFKDFSRRRDKKHADEISTLSDDERRRRAVNLVISVAQQKLMRLILFYLCHSKTELPVESTIRSHMDTVDACMEDLTVAASSVQSFDGQIIFPALVAFLRENWNDIKASAPFSHRIKIGSSSLEHSPGNGGTSRGSPDHPFHEAWLKRFGPQIRKFAEEVGARIEVPDSMSADREARAMFKLIMKKILAVVSGSPF
ncbi:hypothetical protein B0T19DRAFT_444173 [Cercophora scortea]|uniref:NACHT domain-containing protein n=1 Tax=Cercophora scortea TaxID=314031 RepID=A0AAE0IGU6_9PEZI|nr:hypothetical protein B0T19DRAFT_444173 [Cercophora scortea]